MWRAVVMLALVAGCKGSEPSRTPPPRDAAPITHVQEALGDIVATCAEVTGTVEIRRRGQTTWERAAIGTTLRERDWVRTAGSSFVRVRVQGRGYLDVRENTTLLVDAAIGVEGGTVVGVAESTTEPLVIKASDGSEARILAAGADKSAEFRVTPRDDKSLEIAATKGELEVATGDSKLTVPTGRATRVAGDKTSALSTLIAFPRSIAPGIDARFKFVADQAIQMRWQPVKNAAGYRVQVARDVDFRELVYDRDVPETMLAFVPKTEGMYAWRVAARDRLTLLGEFGFARRVYLEAEQPRDLLLAPVDGTKVGYSGSYAKIEFSWQSLGDIAQYRLVIGRSKVPTIEPVLTVPTTGQRVEVGTLRQGTYYWGVYALRDGKDEPIFLTPRVLTIREQRVKAHTENLWNEGAR